MSLSEDIGTDFALARAIFGGGAGGGKLDGKSSTGAVNSVVTLQGTALTDSANGRVTVALRGEAVTGNAEQGVEMGTTVDVRKGDTVIVTVTNGVPVVTGVVGGGDRTQTGIKDTADKAAADLKAVDDAFNAFKESHKLTDEDINTSISTEGNRIQATIEGQIGTMIDDHVGETYAKKTDVTADIDGLRTEVSENYQNKTDAGTMQKDLESKITQNSTSIQTEVTNRTQAVTGALADAKSYTDQQAESITSTVEKNVTDSIGETYATKTEVKQSVDGVTTTIRGELKPVSDKADQALEASNKAVTSVTVEYASNTSSTAAPTSGWSTTMPTLSTGQQLWQRTKTVCQDGTSSTSTPVCLTSSADGGRTLTKVETAYYLSTSSTEQTGGEWTNTQPTWESGKYIWTRSAMTWSDGSTTFTTPQLATAMNDALTQAHSYETLIRDTSDGVEVAKKVDGSYTATKSVLKDTGLSVQSSSGTEYAHFQAKEASLGSGTLVVTSQHPNYPGKAAVWAKGSNSSSSGSAQVSLIAGPGGSSDVTLNLNAYQQQASANVRMFYANDDMECVSKPTIYGSNETGRTTWHDIVRAGGGASAVSGTVSSSYSGLSIKYFKRGGIVTVDVERSASSATINFPSSGSTNIGSIPTAYAPPVSVAQLVGTQNGAWLYVGIGTTGAVNAWSVYGNSSTDAAAFTATFTYVI